MIRWIFEKWWACVLGLALIAWLAGTLVMQQVASNGGNALGQGVKGGFTLVGAIGDGYAAADAVDSQVKVAAANQRIKDAEARARAAEKKARAAEKKAQRKAAGK